MVAWICGLPFNGLDIHSWAVQAMVKIQEEAVRAFEQLVEGAEETLPQDRNIESLLPKFLDPVQRLQGINPNLGPSKQR